MFNVTKKKVCKLWVVNFQIVRNVSKVDCVQEKAGMGLSYEKDSVRSREVWGGDGEKDEEEKDQFMFRGVCY